MSYLGLILFYFWHNSWAGFLNDRKKLHLLTWFNLVKVKWNWRKHIPIGLKPPHACSQVWGNLTQKTWKIKHNGYTLPSYSTPLLLILEVQIKQNKPSWRYPHRSIYYSIQETRSNKNNNTNNNYYYKKIIMTSWCQKKSKQTIYQHSIWLNYVFLTKGSNKSTIFKTNYMSDIINNRV